MVRCQYSYYFNRCSLVWVRLPSNFLLSFYASQRFLVVKVLYIFLFQFLNYIKALNQPHSEQKQNLAQILHNKKDIVIGQIDCLLKVYIHILVNCYNSYKSMLKIYMIAVLLVVGTVSQFKPTTIPLTIPANTIQLDYSPDHKFLGILTANQFTILVTQTGKKVQDLALGANFTASSFAFSQDSSALAVGSKQGETRLFQYDGTVFADAGKSYKDQSASTVDSLCFTSDKKYIISAINQNQIIGWSWNDDTKIIADFNNSYANTVACSPTNPILFVAGGGATLQSQLVFYQINSTSFDIINKTVTTQMQVQSTCWNEDGTWVYKLQADGKLYKYDDRGSNQQKIDFKELNSTASYKVRVSGNERLIGVATANKIFLMTPDTTVNPLKPDLKNLLAVQGFDTTVPSLALSVKGEFVAYYDSVAGQGAGLSECNAGQYTDDTGACVDCNVACPICDGGADTCYQCAQKYYLNVNTCTKCTLGCLGCQSGTTCDNCDTNFRPVGGACECNNGFFIRVQSCLACSTGCTDCTDQNTCTACKPEFVLKNAACECKPATYPSGDTCQNCIRACLDCTEGTTCITCDTQNRYTKDANNTCVCDATLNVRDNGTDCVCNDGYYDNANNICTACPAECKTCDSATACKTCQGNLVEKSGACKCAADTQWVNTTDFTCKQCADTLPYCISCSDPNACTTCDATLNRISVAGKCQCEPGYFEDGQGVCTLCSITGCLECSALDTCTRCDAVNHWQKNTKNNCSCMKKYYEDVTNKTCQACSLGCNNCTSATDCSECDDANNFVDNAGTCECKPAHYLNGQVCSKCIFGCTTCDNGNTCTTCDAGNNWIKNATTNKCVCVNNRYYQNADKCVSCTTITNCIKCTGATSCITCSEPFIVSKGKCACEIGKYQSGKQCKECPEGCQACNNADVCTSCKDGYDLEDNKCKKNGIDTLVIVLVVVGVIVLAGAVFVVIKCIKKRKSPLSQDDYEEL